MGGTDRRNEVAGGKTDREAPQEIKPFDQMTPGDRQAFERFVQQMTAPNSQDNGIVCKDIYKSKKDATQVTSLEFDTCYFSQTLDNGRSRQIEAPVMQPGADGTPRPVKEKITTEGVTMDSRRLYAFVHALPSVRPVSFDTAEGKKAGTAFFVSSDGLMATNAHVEEGSQGRLKVKLLRPDGSEEERDAFVVKRSPGQDLSLLQVVARPGETFQALKLSKVTDWRQQEPLVQIGNANGEGKISMAKARFSGLINQNEIPFDQQPKDVYQGRTLFKVEAPIPRGYSGGVILSVPGSQKDVMTGRVTMNGESAVRGVTVYSDTNKTAYVIPAARVQFLLDEYRKEKEPTAKKP
ncbi:MAG: trypsin-like peptidase domain-containing protein [Candidatus Obscuribacter phosphatis]|uniref:Trypsin-like peptidase domain-containing protein n=1 Tax=Candidatus Obscuribacter phosphatis TaxID=1906157 RepID=A0A8J7P8K7_9BACT|nr:trypsin-like peptidase domain-containing protein [Candidatus Obscuribacter phosphatis]